MSWSDIQSKGCTFSKVDIGEEMIKVEKAFEDQDIVEKLLVRAEIRRAIRKENDRIADLCEEAAKEILLLRQIVQANATFFKED